jgi:acyl carrier protein
MQSELDTVEPVRAFIVDNFLFGSREGLSDDESFLEAGIIDSTGILELVTFLERTYGIQISDTELVPENLDSLNNISRYIRSKQAVGTETVKP